MIQIRDHLQSPRQPQGEDSHAAADSGFGVARRWCSGEAEAIELTASRAVLPVDLIHDDEVIILLLRPSPWYIILASLGGLACIAVLTFALAYMSRLAWVGWTDTQAFALGVGLTTLRVGWQLLEWYSRVYVLTDRRIIRRMGVIRVAVFQTDLRNIQHISVFQQLRERMLGLGTIGFATAGSDVFDAFWVMVSDPFKVHGIVNEAITRYGKH